MLFDVFVQGLGSPAVASNVPMAVVLPLGVHESGALAEYVVSLVDDGNVEGCRYFAQRFESEGFLDLQRVRRQDD